MSDAQLSLQEFYLRRNNGVFTIGPVLSIQKNSFSVVLQYITEEFLKRRKKSSSQFPNRTTFNYVSGKKKPNQFF